MAGNLDFFPKVDRAANTNSQAAPTSGLSKVRNAQKTGVSAPGASFADELGKSREESESPGLEKPAFERKSSTRSVGSEARAERSSSSKEPPVIQERENTRSEKPVAVSSRGTVDRLNESPKVDGAIDASATASSEKSAQIAAQPGSGDVSGVELTDAQFQQKAALKQQAVVEFLNEMETKFGVSPEKILAAFAELDEDALNGKPEAAMSQFLAALQLPPTQIPDAKKLYQKMVRETGEQALNERLGNGKQIVSLQVLTPKDQRQMKMHESLNAMSNRFFPQPVQNAPKPAAGSQDPLAAMMNGEQLAADSQISALGEDPKIQQADTQSLRAQNESQNKNGAIPAAFSAIAGAMGGAGAAASAGAKASTGSMSAMTAGANDSASGLSSLLGDELEQGLEEFMANSDASGGSAGDALSKFSQNQGQGAFSAAMVGAAGGAAKFAMPTEKSTEAEKSVSIDTATPALAGTQGQQPAAELKAPLAPGAMIVQAPQPTPDQQQTNINEIIRQAQVVMKRGGGEMKVQLQPEGLGEVSLKVLVQDGQVNVQMLAENDSTKKILESGLNDLKAQLAAHKLHVETLKVDMAQDSAFKKFEQGFQDAQREQARQMASDFMGQFREDRQAFHQGFMDRPMRGYSRPQKRGPVEPTPADGVSASKAQSARNNDSSRRLNLVA